MRLRDFILHARGFGTLWGRLSPRVVWKEKKGFQECPLAIIQYSGSDNKEVIWRTSLYKERQPPVDRIMLTQKCELHEEGKIHISSPYKESPTSVG